MKENSLKRVKPIFFIGVLIFLILAVVLVAVFSNADNAYAYPDWIEAYKVGLSFEASRLVTTSNTNKDTVDVIVVCGIPSGIDMNVVKVRIRTRNGTAVAGVDYTAFDDVVEL
jgi:hypothetical protein